MEIEFKSKEENVDLWMDVFSYLENGNVDANIQDKMSIFGKKVDNKLEKLIEENGDDAIRVEFWSCDENEFSAMIYISSPDHRNDLIGFFKACGVVGFRWSEDSDF